MSDTTAVLDGGSASVAINTIDRRQVGMVTVKSKISGRSLNISSGDFIVLNLSKNSGNFQENSWKN
jgi:hypothetical protein